MRTFLSFAIVALALTAAPAAGQGNQAPRAATSAAAAVPTTAAGLPLPADYVIGPEDVLGVLFWREPDMSADVTVRPDGKITLPLIGEMMVTGLKPDVLRDQLQKAGGKYLADANVTVVVRQINSRKVFITGQVAQPGAFPLTSPRTVLQLIALAGGLGEYAEGDNITILRTGSSGPQTLKFNYKDVSKGKKLEQNIQLQPGDTVVVP
jgi:polysaccharide export outer membrane protein